MASFYTIKEKGEGLYKEKGSKFLAFAIPVESIEQIEEALTGIRKRYHDARHHCYAYILGLEDQDYRANDDGEPNHSAGDPILGQIRSFQLTNCLVVVVRYFGGTKLGVGGLITAYKTAAASALEKLQRIEIFETETLRLSFGYDQLGFVEKALNDWDAKVLQRDFTNTCIMTVEISKEKYGALDHTALELRNIEVFLRDRV